MIALVMLSSRRSVMGSFVSNKATVYTAIAMTVVIVALNLVLIGRVAW